MTIDESKAEGVATGVAADHELGKSEADVGHPEAPAETTAAADGVEFLEPTTTDGTTSHSPSTEAPVASRKSTEHKVLYIGNLFFEVSDDALYEEFAKIGTVVKANVVKDPRGLSRGFGFVEYASAEDAAAAIKALDQEVLEGRRMLVQLHKPKPKLRSTSPREPTTTVFIGNMSYEMSDKDLSDLFRDMRNVLDVRVAIDRNTGQNRGFAHADFADVESAQEGFDKLRGKVVHGRALRVDFSTPSSMTRQQ